MPFPTIALDSQLNHTNLYSQAQNDQGSELRFYVQEPEDGGIRVRTYSKRYFIAHAMARQAQNLSREAGRHKKRKKEKIFQQKA